jgi:hypothetical protein
MPNTALNRTSAALLTNKSGGDLVYGDVVVLDNTNAKGFTTTTTAGLTTRGLGIILEPNGIANDATGLVALGGYCPQVNLNTAATIGQFIQSHTVAGQGTPHDSPQQAGDFAVALTASDTPEAILFGAANSAGDTAGAASSTDEALARFHSTTGKVLQNSAITLSDTGALTFPDNVRQTFNPGADAAGLNVGAVAAEPGTLVNGDIWYDSATDQLFGYVDGAPTDLAAGSPGGSDTEVQFNDNGIFGGITGATTDGTTLTLVAPVLGTPASGTLTNCTGLPEAGQTIADNTTHNASTTAHGYAPKATAPAAGLLNVLGIGNGETVWSAKAAFDTTNPADLGTASPGTQVIAARRDHVHTLPKLDDLAAPDNNTDLNVSTTAHGLAPLLPNDATKYLDGTGNYTVPAGSGSVTVFVPSAGADESLSSSTVLQDDDVFAMPVLANSNYLLEMTLHFNSGNSNGVDATLAFTLPASATLTWSVVEYDTTATAITSLRMASRYQSVVQLGAGVIASPTGEANCVILRGLIRVAGTAGNVTLQWAQGTSSTQALTRKADSWAILTKVA